jgi:hypothetical protein
MRHVLVFLCALTVAVGSASAEQSSGATLLTATVCEVLAHPLKYDGHVIQISGRVAGTDEGAWLLGDNCPGVLVSNKNHVWPSTIFLATPSATTLGRTRLHSVDFDFDFDSERKENQKYKELRRRTADRCIQWVYTGLFETRADWSKAEVKYPNGTTRVIGFGHLGEAPAQLILKSADNVSPIPDCGNRTSKRR